MKKLKENRTLEERASDIDALLRLIKKKKLFKIFLKELARHQKEEAAEEAQRKKSKKSKKRLDLSPVF